MLRIWAETFWRGIIDLKPVHHKGKGFYDYKYLSRYAFKPAQPYQSVISKILVE